METILEVITFTFSKQGGLILLEKLPILLVGVFVGILIRKIKEVLRKWIGYTDGKITLC